MKTHPILVHSSFTAHLNDQFYTDITHKKESYAVIPSDRIITFFYTNSELTGISYSQGLDDHAIRYTQEPDPGLNHIVNILKATDRLTDYTIEMVDDLLWILFAIENPEF